MSFSSARFTRFLSVTLIALTTLLPTVGLGHGGEDHGDQKPKSSANAKGIVSHSARLGDVEVMVKHPVLEPDQPTTGRLFITRFGINEPFTDAGATVQLESASGAVFAGTVEAWEQPGTYNVKLPALPEGVYSMQTKLSYGGETDTATFSGIDVKGLATGGDGGISSVTTGLIGVVFTLVILLLCGLIYFVWHFAAEQGTRETVSD